MPAPSFGDFQKWVIDEFRANAGVVGDPFEGSSLLLLTTTGARTRRRHTTPLGYLDIDGVRVVVASAGGADHHPAWLHNLRAHPIVTVEVGTEKYPAVASVMEDRALWDEVVRQAPGYGEYQRKTSRVIPLVELRPLPTAGAERVSGLGDFVKEAHEWLDTELEAVLAQVDELIATADTTTPMTLPPRTLHDQMRERCLAFCGALEQHHNGEDRGAFPMLAAEFPALAPTLEKLQAEHVVVAETNASIRELVEGYVPGVADPRGLRAELQGLVSRLREHFAYEEATILDALNAINR
ncbi:deazaflavin-dependent oxidoreductase, nitroreductase family [Lentzea fradiae]|uniref:Deazaflavin-dependent oxidoreductase, nitroreductase family n=1 Tax=Lentzea fradiae TaxID=200378 RepID=A0A1G8AV11_9PSEU|nr:nitroreductase/quinone reductase family protein [Lentzea fradiae]SDH24805.1 deazaflavin-dependent oxidoreductase, nitroreductase family [Lentzea fradiae]